MARERGASSSGRSHPAEAAASSRASESRTHGLYQRPVGSWSWRERGYVGLWSSLEQDRRRFVWRWHTACSPNSEATSSGGVNVTNWKYEPLVRDDPPQDSP